ncbi:MAG: acetyl-CoA carboxylase biotin carboxyl carrier protein subunit, partial [Candidatus Limnocylindrales bacterium]
VLELPRSGAARSADIRRFEVVVDGWLLEVTVEPSRRALLRERATRGARAAGVNSRLTLRAQIPGRVVRVWVAAGDTIETGQRLLAVEAMKMENEVRAPRAGSVDSVAVAVGQTVELGDELVVVS